MSAKRPRCPRGVGWATFINLYGHMTDICIEWPWSIGGDGYGQMWDCRGKSTKPHIAACEMAHGERPSPEMVVAHSCGNRACFNPRHLRWATQAENHADKLIHGTHNRGERNHGAVLTEDQVRDVKRRLVAGERPVDVARGLGVGNGVIYAIRDGRSWAWLDGVS